MFDSLKYAKILERSGVIRKQAEAHMHVLANVMGEDVATKHDVAAVNLRLETVCKRIDDLESKMKVEFLRVDQRFEQLELRIGKKLEEKMQAMGYKLQNDLMVKLGGLITFLFAVGTAALGFVVS